MRVHATTLTDSGLGTGPLGQSAEVTTGLATAAGDSAVGAYCPHCHLMVSQGALQPWPPAPVRCPHCQLLIGMGRGRTEPSSDPGAKGTAAGVFSRQAKRDEAEPSASPERVLVAIRTVAESTGERPERLLMVDYQQLAATDPDIPSLSDVFAAFGSWKRARRHAADSAQAG
ncbi:MAG: hypothetical protein LC808_07680 [Actinobacteria bacterium]|nr:hypothetical protein [Actinomycetota bacterium]